MYAWSVVMAYIVVNFCDCKPYTKKIKALVFDHGKLYSSLFLASEK